MKKPNKHEVLSQNEAKAMLYGQNLRRNFDRDFPNLVPNLVPDASKLDLSGTVPESIHEAFLRGFMGPAQ